MKKLDRAKLGIGLAAALCLVFVVCAVATEESTTDESKSTTESIWIAMKNGNIEVIEKHLAEVLDVDARILDDSTLLHGAALFGQTEIMKLLIQKGADVNISNNDGATPLHVAALFGRMETAEILIQNGADVNARYSDGAVPLDLTALDWGTTEYVASSLEIELDEEEVKAGRAEVASILRQQAAKNISEKKLAAEEVRPEEVIEQMIRESIAAVNSQDIRNHVKNHHPTRYSVFGASPQSKLAFLPKEFLIEMLEKLFPIIGNINSSGPIDLNIWVHGNAAFATYLAIRRTGTESLTVRNTDIYYRIDGVWQLVHSHQSGLIEQ